MRKGRFKLAAVFVMVGLVVGGFDLPSGWFGWTLLGVKLLLGVLVGIARGRRVTLWRDATSQPHARGNRLTVGLFLGLLAAKAALSL